MEWIGGAPAWCSTRPGLCAVTAPPLILDTFATFTAAAAVAGEREPVPVPVSREFAVYSFWGAVALITVLSFIFWKRLDRLERFFREQVQRLREERPAGTIGVQFLEERFREMDEKILVVQADLKHLSVVIEDGTAERDDL